MNFEEIIFNISFMDPLEKTSSQFDTVCIISACSQLCNEVSFSGKIPISQYNNFMPREKDLPFFHQLTDNGPIQIICSRLTFIRF